MFQSTAGTQNHQLDKCFPWISWTVACYQWTTANTMLLQKLAFIVDINPTSAKIGDAFGQKRSILSYSWTGKWWRAILTQHIQFNIFLYFCDDSNVWSSWFLYWVKCVSLQLFYHAFRVTLTILYLCNQRLHDCLKMKLFGRADSSWAACGGCPVQRIVQRCTTSSSLIFIYWQTLWHTVLLYGVWFCKVPRVKRTY